MGIVFMVDSVTILWYLCFIVTMMWCMHDVVRFDLVMMYVEKLNYSSHRRGDTIPCCDGMSC